jgi:hypothetical protein
MDYIYIKSIKTIDKIWNCFRKEIALRIKYLIINLFYLLCIIGTITIPTGIILWIWVAGNLGLKIAVTGIIISVISYGIAEALESI